MEGLQQIDTDGVAPLAHVLPIENVFREDDVGQCFRQEEVLANAPEQSDGMFQYEKLYKGRIVTISRLTIHELHELLVKKEISAVELTREHLDRIQTLDGDVKAYITVTDQLALEQAKAVDAKISAGESIGMLAGIPMAVKDKICVQKESILPALQKCWMAFGRSTALLLFINCRQRMRFCWEKRIWMNLLWGLLQKTLPFLLPKIHGMQTVCPAVPAAALLLL